MIKYIYPWPQWAFEYLQQLWKHQGKTRNTCSGMSSFSFWPEHITYDATNDALYSAHEWRN